MVKCPDIVKKLIERFTQQSDQVLSPDYNETQLRVDYVNPMFSALGWDMDNSSGYAEQYRDVVHEDRLKVAGQTKAPDYSFRVGGSRKFFLEAKRPSVNIKMAVEPAYQLRRYGWSANLDVSILTDFEELAVYDCRVAPKHLDKPSVARREYITYSQYIDQWEFIEGTFSKRAVLQGDFDRYCRASKVSGHQEFDDAFLEEIEEWRKKLASNIAVRNELGESGVNFAVQRIIDRIIFLRIAEDRGTEEKAQLRKLLDVDDVYGHLRKIFRSADSRYNSGLFHFQIEKGRSESPDTLTPRLEIDDSTIKAIIRRIYYPDSPYEFTVVSADILGSVYERFLGKIIRLTPGRRAKIEDKPEVRHAGGVYYTPTYIADYIVKNTIGKILDGMTPEDARMVKILDPACGSGSFLINAYQYMLDWYLSQYTEGNPESLSIGKSAIVRHGPTGDWQLTIAERKRILLDNIHGVDIDSAAVEVTKLNLLLKCLEGETSQSLGFNQRLFRDRALPDLGRNVLCGNSIIDTDVMTTDAWGEISEEEKERINPFSYNNSFSKVLKQGGFDSIIGNPPYIFTRSEGIAEFDKRYFYEHFEHQAAQLNTFSIFVEKSLSLLSSTGQLAFITPNNWLTIDTFGPLRRLLLESPGDLRIINILDRVFEAADVDTAIILLRKGNKALDVALSEMAGGEITFDGSAPRSAFRQPDFVIQIGLLKDVGARLILEKVESKAKPLSAFATVSTGLKAYQTGKGKPVQTDRIKGSRSFHSDKKIDASYEKYLEGSDVCRYQLKWSGEYLSYGDWLAEPRRTVPFSSPRILVRQIPSQPPYMVQAVLTDGRYLNDINSMVIFSPVTRVSLECILGIINSRLVSYWFAKTFDKMQRRIFPQFKVKELARFPVPSILETDASRDQVQKLVEKMLSLRQRLAVEPLPQRQEQISRQIDATDQQLDQLIYGLYGLSKEEIKIVEGSA